MFHTSDLPPILLFAHAVLCGRDLDECELAFARLCKEDLEAAIHLADMLVLAIPHTAPIWQAIIEYEGEGRTLTSKEWQAKRQMQNGDVDRQSGPAMGGTDAVDTAGGIAERMGWAREL